MTQHPTRGDCGALDPAQALACAFDRPEASANEDAANSEIVDDGQEEVFSRTAIENGFVEDPRALGPEDLARVQSSRVQNVGA